MENSKIPDSGDKQRLRQNQGQAYEKALQYMKNETGTFNLQEADDYIISSTSEKAEGFYALMPEGGLEWQTPNPNENQHIEVIVQDREDQRFLPNLEVFYELRDIDNNFISQDYLSFIWHPFLFHYGANIEIPQESEYKLKVTVKAPSFNRHDEILGKKYANDVTVELGPIKMTPGQKPHGPE